MSILSPALNFIPSTSPILASAVPNTAVNGITGLAAAANSGLGNIVQGIPQASQYFFTVPFANNQAVLYKLEISVTSQQALNTTYTFIFPLTPNNVTKSVMNLTNYYDVKGGSTNFGVQRIIDQYGLTPPIITISGTTGFQFHSVDKYQWSGRSSFALLVQFIQTYATLVAQAINSNPPSNMPIMTFTDGFTGEVFSIVPLNQQAYSMDVSKPIIQMYNLQFLAQDTTTPQATALSQQDALAQAFLSTKAILTGGFLAWWNSLLAGLPGGSIT